MMTIDGLEVKVGDVWQVWSADDREYMRGTIVKILDDRRAILTTGRSRMYMIVENYGESTIVSLMENRPGAYVIFRGHANFIPQRKSL